MPLSARPCWALLLLLQACYRPQVPFVEPAWGDAPPPYPAEVTEITLDIRSCPSTGPSCPAHRILFRRDGSASSEYGSAERPDSSFTGRIDSVAYNGLVLELIRLDFFRTDSNEHEPLTLTTYVASAATYCRRATGSFTMQEFHPGVPAVPTAILSTAASIHWERVVRLADRPRRAETVPSSL